jgi:hypothetical protein
MFQLRLLSFLPHWLGRRLLSERLSGLAQAFQQRTIDREVPARQQALDLVLRLKWTPFVRQPEPCLKVTPRAV